MGLGGQYVEFVLKNCMICFVFFFIFGTLSILLLRACSWEPKAQGKVLFIGIAQVNLGLFACSSWLIWDIRNGDCCPRRYNENRVKQEPEDN
jgi:hypothetical protein